MKSRRLLGTVALAAACVMLGSGLTASLTHVTAAQAETQTIIVTSPFTQAIAEVRQSVVGVNNYQNVRYNNYPNGWGSYFFGYGYGFGNDRGNNEPQTQEVLAGTGSGTVIADGYVLTNYHVVEDNARLTVSVSDYDTGEIRTCDAELVAYDDTLDIAVVYAPDMKLPAVKLGDSDSLLVGDWAICIGNPLGENFFGTVTTGIVSAMNRSVSSSSYDKYGRRETITNTMIQTDASINNGNSGGGMFAVTGELMGIPTLKYSGSSYTTASVEGIGMCIPINVAKPLIEEVLSGKIATPEMKPAESAAAASTGNDLTGRPRLGITIKSISAQSTAVLTGALPKGVYVGSVDENGPAAQAGMEAADIIVDVDDTVITSVSQLQEILASHKEGDTLAIKVYRVPGLADLPANESIPDGSYIDLQVTLAVIDDVAQ